MIADYEAARLEESREGNDGPETRDSEQTATNQTGLLTTLRRRLTR
jgi:hypothetical protein